MNIQRAAQIFSIGLLLLLVVPPACFMAIYDASEDHGHPPAIIIPILWVYLGFRFVAPLGVIVSTIALLKKNTITARSLNYLRAACILLLAGSSVAWYFYFNELF
jgi:hypothetical protein